MAFMEALATLGAGATQMLGGFIQNAASAKQAQANREWQEGMSANAHQREVADLRAAGLNPILSGTGGAGAPGGPGATASMVNPMSGVVSSALDTRRNIEEVKNLEKEGLRIDSQAWLNRALKVQAEETTGQLIEQQRKTAQETATERERTGQTRSLAEIAASSAKGAKLEGEIDETRYGAVMRYLDRAVKALTGSARSLRDVAPR